MTDHDIITRRRSGRDPLAPILCALVVCAAPLPAPTAEDDRPPGALAEFVSLEEGGPERVDHAVAEGIQLYVPAGQPPTPFLKPGRFEVAWTGFLSVDLRSDMFFRADVRGSFTLEVNGEPVLRHEGSGNLSPLSAPVRMRKGTNDFRAVLTSPASGDTWARLLWGEDETWLGPIPGGSLSRGADPAALRRSLLRRAGRGLALEYRCFHCHAAEPASNLPELSMDAPSLDGIGARRRFGWMAEWILDPRSLRRAARMPGMWHGPDRETKARAIAAYLASATADDAIVPGRDEDPEADARAARALERARALGRPVADTWYERLHCAACHGPLGEEPDDPGLISLRGVNDKFPPGQLEAFLRRPNAHYAWIPMPNFHLTTREAAALAASLRSAARANRFGAVPSPVDPALIGRGREWVETGGCLNCHASALENRFQARAWTALEHWDRGCVSAAPQPGSNAPYFAFTARERDALIAFAGVGLDSLKRHVPSEFAERQSRRLHCANCHGKYDGFPAWDGLGGKLKPEWMTSLLAGTLPSKPRPWLPARMPAFETRAGSLAKGLAMHHGFPPATPPEPAVDEALAEIGRRLAGRDGGFSCVSCHAVGTQRATEVFEAEGINFDRVAERLQKPFYRRWMLNPARIDPQTKMPVYFDQGYSPLPDVLEGNADRQIEALWQFFRLR